MVRSRAEIDELAQRAGVTTGLAGGCRAEGLCWGQARLILVPRLDSRGLIGHELVHLCQGIVRRPLREGEAQRAEVLQ